jgi:NO-binding membrane sensor protein with MHYT domain
MLQTLSSNDALSSILFVTCNKTDSMMFPDHTLLLGSYDYRLVALSVLIAVFASYAALDLAGRLTVAQGSARLVWLVGGAGAMGMGVWSMHYIGMLAFTLPIPVWYDWPTVLLSLLAAILASAAALHFASAPGMGLWRTVYGSILMGSGIGAMHYIGMYAMRMRAMCFFDPTLVVPFWALASRFRDCCGGIARKANLRSADGKLLFVASETGRSHTWTTTRKNLCHLVPTREGGHAVQSEER